MAKFPISPIASTVGLTSEFPSAITYAQDGTRYVRADDAHRWVLMAGYSLLSDEEFSPIAAFITQQHGRFGSFLYTPPELAVPLGTALGSPVVDGADQTGTTLLISGCDPDQDSLMLRGDVFTFSGSTKVYMMSADVSSDGAGAATLKFRPALVESPADLEVLTFSGVEFTVELEKDEQEVGVRSPLLFAKELKFLEVV